MLAKLLLRSNRLQGKVTMQCILPQQFAFRHHFALQQIVSEQQLRKPIAADNFSCQ